MTFTKVAVVAFLALLGFSCWLAASGFGAAREVLISLVVLVVLVGGGNLLSGRGGHYGRRGAPSSRDPGATEPGGGLDASRSDEPAP
ncbi:MAG: hypothetical protein ACRDXC_04750 [Acidimicrobiales bacterium]